MDETFFFTVFEGLPRQGPGSDTCTARAFNLIPDLPGHTRILDIGCGSGMQTLALAKLCPEATITACDIYQPFLDDLSERAKNAGLDTRIKTMRASMENLPFPEKSVDLIWAEGSAFIMGFKEALHCWRRFLKPHGYMALSDCVWFTKKPSDECRQYFNEHYPAMIHEQDATTLIGEAGYTVLDILRLPDAAWWDHYYTPLSLKLEILIQQYKGDQEVLDLLNSFVQEIQVFRNHSKEYGYSFFIIRKEDE
ncbi:MAG: class I SAM-dependent methyltransferase [Methanomicrobiales archaeon]